MVVLLGMHDNIWKPIKSDEIDDLLGRGSTEPLVIVIDSLDKSSCTDCALLLNCARDRGV
jgi:hypothetical protein